jgi:AcrR family transcriptional regulator
MPMQTLTTSRIQRRTHTRQKILEAARRVFEARGFAGARTQDVAEAAGVSHGSVFVHFHTREVLIAAVVDGAILDAEAITRRRLKSARAIEDVLQGHLDGLVRHEDIYARIIAERSFLPKVVQARITEINSAVSSHIIDALEENGLKDGLKVQPYFAFNTWIALIHYYLANHDLFAPSGSVLAARGGEIISNYLAMIRRTMP